MEAIRQRFCNTLSFVVACTRANRVDVTPANSRHWHSASTVEMESNVLVFRLWVDLRVTVNLCQTPITICSGHLMNCRTRCTADQETSLGSLSQAEHVQSAHERSLDGLDSIGLIVRWRGRARQVIDFWHESYFRICYLTKHATHGHIQS